MGRAISPYNTHIMATIVIAYYTIDINGETIKIYYDATEKYFENANINDAVDYIEYLGKKGYSVDVADIVILQQGSLTVEDLYREDALAKLTTEEKQILGLP